MEGGERLLKASTRCVHFTAVQHPRDGYAATWDAFFLIDYMMYQTNVPNQRSLMKLVGSSHRGVSDSAAEGLSIGYILHIPPCHLHRPEISKTQ